AVCAAAGSARAALLFSDDFAYANGNLAGNGGGTGWLAASVWTGGTGATGNQVANPLPGTSGKSIKIASNAAVTSRPLSATYTSGGATTYYLSFGFNGNPFQGAGSGQYAGVSVYLASDPSSNLLGGMPGDSGGLGFDWTNRAAPFQAASDNTTYLSLLKISPGTSGTSVAMFVTTDLLMSGTALAATTPWAQIENEANFSFDSVSFAGGYSTGTISLAGLAMADNPTEAVSFTQAAVPEPATAMLCLAAAAGMLAACRRMRCRAA
ncbi:MAG: hypothetical protein RLZZ440_765, partial [Planctomycetota bacterium]